MARRPEDRYREQQGRPSGGPHDRDDDAESYGQYGSLNRGLGYGGGRDIESIERFGRGHESERPPRGHRSGEEAWREPGWQEEDEHPRSHGRRRGLTERAADEVSAWLGDEDARRRRQADHRGKGPKGYTRSDERIRDEVCDRLTDDPDVDATDITVTVTRGEVTLDGHVDSRAAKRHAEDCADSVSGVQHVQNNLRVRPAGRDVSPPPQGGGTG